MNPRHLLPATALLLALSGCADPSSPATGPAAAVAARDWDGTWKGRTGPNRTVEIDVQGGRATRYSFRGTEYPVIGSSLSGETMTVRISGGRTVSVVSTMTLTRTSPTAADFVFTGYNNSQASARLTRG